MGRFRYTMKELNEFSDYRLLAAVVLDRESSCTNSSAPLPRRLSQLYKKLRNCEELTKEDNA